jgi:hypothetical protein
MFAPINIWEVALQISSLFLLISLIFININLYNCSCDYLYSFCLVCPLLCVVLCAVFRLIVVLFCVLCVIYLLCLIVKTHLQLK